MGIAMRRRLKNFLPIVLVALMVQILAPIGACWATSLAASDPLAFASICHVDAGGGTGPGDQTGGHAHDGCCSICSVLHTGAPIDTPQPAAAIAVERAASEIVWHDFAAGLDRSPASSHARARAPPSFS
jgi:hypothetical protein